MAAGLRDASRAFLHTACALHLATEHLFELTQARQPSSTLARQRPEAALHAAALSLASQTVGPSMLPTFGPERELLLVENLSPQLRSLRRGDVVVAFSPIHPRQRVCKRIVALPGDAEPPLFPLARTRRLPLPPGYLWLQGDNLSNSTDSRSYGALPYCLVRGRAIMRLWPPSKMGRIPDATL